MSRSKLAVQFSPMLYFFISCVPLFLISQSLTHRTLQLCESVIKILSIWFCGEFSRFLVSSFGQKTSIISPLKSAMTLVSLKNMTFCCSPRGEVAELESLEEGERAVSLLDLPDLALDCIFERLSPVGLRAMAGVCSSLREPCTSDHLWERHLRQKWGRLLGESAYREWQSELASNNRNGPNRGSCDYESNKRKSSSWLLLMFEFLVKSRPLSWVMPKQDKVRKVRTKLPADSIMAWYLSFESGKFWFPAQVFNRENGHIGFMLSCYDAHLCYDSDTDTFEARYSPNGRRITEDNIGWDRLRAQPVDSNPFALHVSDGLHGLKPGDHIEIQWRRNKEFPYGWWYGIVSHLELCDGNENLCRCHSSDTVELEFKQYNPGSRWRRTSVKRKDHREEGNEVDGFYGGIRKLQSNDEIARWNRFWPTQVLEQ